MILLRPDCLVFKRADGHNVPCSAHEVILQLLGDSAEQMEEDFLQNVAEAVLHYFKEDLGWTTVSVRRASPSPGPFTTRMTRFLQGTITRVSPSVAGRGLQVSVIVWYARTGIVLLGLG